MIRVNFHLPEPQLEALRARSRETGIPVAELVRRAIDAYLAAQPGKPSRKPRKEPR